MVRVIAFALFILAMIGLAVMASGYDREKCENEIPKVFHKPAKYWHGQCIVEGYGKVIV